jgi:SET domain-containing protein
MLVVLVMSVFSGGYIDVAIVAGRFVNHSCEPNCEMQKWSVNGLFRMALFALREIQPHEELSYDYNFSLFNPAEGQVFVRSIRNCQHFTYVSVIVTHSFLFPSVKEQNCEDLLYFTSYSSSVTNW